MLVDLHSDLLILIFQYLSCEDVLRIGLVCTKFSKIYKHDNIWEQLYLSKCYPTMNISNDYYVKYKIYYTMGSKGVIGLTGDVGCTRHSHYDQDARKMLKIKSKQQERKYTLLANKQHKIKNKRKN